MKRETALQIVVRLLNNHEIVVTKCPEVIEVLESYYEIERQQIIDAVDGFPILNRHLDGEQYFTETYIEPKSNEQ